jgi:hypothetical protein
MSTTTPKMTRLGARSIQILDALRAQLADQYSSETALMTEAARRGLLLMAIEAYHNEAGQYGGHSARELARILRHELTGVLNFLVEQDELPALLRIPTMMVAPASSGAGAATAGDMTAPEPSVAAVTIDAAVVESVQLGGQDEDWDD